MLWDSFCAFSVDGESFNFGCLEHSVTPEDLQLLGDYVTVAPNGVCFVRREIFEGVLPRLWRGLLSSRLMVKESMKLYTGDESLKRLLDARQLGLKLIANVIYGYTAASFSGRMPCVEVGDSIVHKGRETLERAIQLVETGSGVLPGTPTPWLTADASCNAKVIYGDTDSLFVKLPHCDKATSFRLGQAIADAVSQANPAPIKLKLEKVFFPCLLEAKKRYVGYAYESAEQPTAVFDAKGIETVRRDSAPFVGKVLESSLRLLFDQFRVWDQPPDLAKVEPKIRAKVRNFATKLINGRIPFSSCILARIYLGQTGYRPGACAPALQVARRLMSVDANYEPLVGERVTYYIAPGRPSEALIGGVRAAQEAWPLISFNEDGHAVSCRRAPAPSLNLTFYLDHQLLPPISRFAELLGWNVQAWLRDLPRLLATSSVGSTITASQARHFPIQIRTMPLSGVDENFVCQSSQLASHHSSTPYVSTRRRGSSRNQRPSSVLQAFLKRSKMCPGCGFAVQMHTDPAGVKNQRTWGHCEQCLLLDPNLPVRSLIAFGAEMNSLMFRLQLTESVCTACIGVRSPDAVSWRCCNLACANRDRRCQLIQDIGRVMSRIPTDFQSLDTFTSWSP
uniref:DNA polymerase zeta catalytic subunit n=3 Tax=Schistocephalus solidus TaxID=70667 RepID=A0A0X3Q8Q5_SCHSO